MKMYMIALIYAGKQHTGCRILDYDTGKTMDASNESIISAIKAGNKIYNLELDKSNQLKGSNGALSRYPQIVNGQLQGAAPMIVLNQIGETGFTVSDFNGNIRRWKKSDAVNYAAKFGIANGMVKTNDNISYISSIVGAYDIEAPKPAAEAPKPAAEAPKPAAEAHKPAAEAPKPVAEAPKPVAEAHKPAAEAPKPAAEAPVKLNFTPEQLSVLKDYYSNSGIDEDIAESEIHDLNESKVLGSKILRYFIYKLGAAYKIVDAFGDDVGKHLISFTMVGLNTPKSLIEKSVNAIKIDIKSFYKKVFSEFEEAIDEVYLVNDSLFFISARKILEYIATVEIFGQYKEFISKEQDEEIHKCMKYALCNDLSIASLRTLIGAVDIAKETRCELESSILNQKFRGRMNDEAANRIYNTLYAYALLYYYNNITFCNVGKSDGTAYMVESYNFDNMNMRNNSKKLSQERRALLDVIGLYHKFYNKELSLKLFEKEVDREVAEESQGLQACRFIGSPIMYRCNTLREEDTIYKLYNTLLYLIKHDTSEIIAEFNRFRTTCQKHFSNIDTVRLQREMAQRNKERDSNKAEIISQKESVKQPETGVKQEAEVNKQPDMTVDTNKSKSASLAESIMSSDSKDRSDKYSELLSMSKVNHDNDISFKIANDMVGKGLKYRDMSSKQHYRLNDALEKLCKELGISYIEAPKDEASKETNNVYYLDKHKDIRDKVKKLVDSADSVEMSAVLEKEPAVLNICYSILKYGKASDRQLKHVNSAIELLDNQ